METNKLILGLALFLPQQSTITTSQNTIRFTVG